MTPRRGPSYLSDADLKDRLKYAATLTDYSLCVGRQNRLLVSKPHVFAPGVNNMPIPADESRVGLWMTATWDGLGGATPPQGIVQILDVAGGNVLWAHQVVAGVIDPSGTVNAFVGYSPLFVSVLDLGPLIQRVIAIPPVRGDVNSLCVTELLRVGRES